MLTTQMPALITLLAAALLAACATTEPVGELRKETVFAVTDAAELIQFNAGQPQRVLARKPLRGLVSGDSLVGLDYRVSHGALFALSARGQLYTLNTATGELKPVGAAAPVPLAGKTIGFNFNPVADRIRVVSDSGLNLRLHPESGALAATDPALAYAPGDAHHGKVPQVVAAAYTYNKANDKLTTNYAIDRAGLLLTQGSREGEAPVESPNTGRLRTVGALGTGALAHAALDIADTDNTALAALRQGGRTRLHLIDLASGRAQLIGTVADGGALWGMAIAP